MQLFDSFKKMFSRKKKTDFFDVNLPEQDQETIQDLVKKEVLIEERAQELLDQKRKVEERIIAIQQSTKVSIPIFAQIHNELRMRFKWYYNWHIMKASGYVHSLILLVYVAIVSSISYSTITFSPQIVYASSKNIFHGYQSWKS